MIVFLVGLAAAVKSLNTPTPQGLRVELWCSGLLYTLWAALSLREDTSLVSAAQNLVINHWGTWSFIFLFFQKICTDFCKDSFSRVPFHHLHLKIITLWMVRPALLINFSLTRDSCSLCHMLWHSIYLIPLRVPWDPKPLYNCLSFHFPLSHRKLPWVTLRMKWPLLASSLFSSLLYFYSSLLARHARLLCFAQQVIFSHRQKKQD